MPGLNARGLRMERPGAAGERAIKRRRACPAKRVSAKQGRADGSSACPGGSPHEPGGVSTKATIPGDMQQTGQIHPRAERRRLPASVAGCSNKQPRRLLLLKEQRLPCASRRRAPCGAPACRNTWRRGRGETPGVPHAPSGAGRQRRQRKCGLPRAERRTGAISHVCTRSKRGWAV